MKRYLIIFLLFAVAVLFNAQMDIISFNPSRAWFDGWWIASNWQQHWIQKYLLGLTVDGWHFCKMVMLTSLAGLITYSNKLKWYWLLLILVGWGVLFEIFYFIG